MLIRPFEVQIDRHRPAGRHRDAVPATADSNHTSKMFSSLRSWSRSNPSGNAKSSPRISRGESVNQLLEPRCPMCRATAITDSLVSRVLAIGHREDRNGQTPASLAADAPVRPRFEHARDPFLAPRGNPRTFSTASIAIARRLRPVSGMSLSTPTNHCSLRGRSPDPCFASSGGSYARFRVGRTVGLFSPGAR